MSDNESDYYDSNSESDEETLQNEVLTKKVAKPIVEFNHAKQFGNYEEDESEIDDSEPDNEGDDDDNDDDDEQIGGVEDDPSSDIENLDKEDEQNIKEEEIDDDDDDDDDDDNNDSEIEIGEDGEPIEKINKQTKISKPKKTTQLIIEDEDEEEEDEYDENYLQKFDNELNKNYIKEFHAECLNHNYEEVLKLARVIRDDRNNIIDELHRTIPYLTKYEKARILGQRAKQIETGAKPLVKVPENIVDGYVIAELELREKKIPFIIKRPIPGGAFEYWHLKDLEIIGF